MPTVEKVSGGRVLVRGIGRFDVGDRAEVSESDAEYLVEERGDFRYMHVDRAGPEEDDPDQAGDGTDGEDDVVHPTDPPPFDPTELTVDELEDRLESEEFTEADLLAVYSAEREADDRATAVEAIDTELDALGEEE